MSGAPLWLWGLLCALLFLSGVFSASETALFSLNDGQRARAGATARRLLAQPRNLLVAVLMCNQVVNVLFFGFVSRLHPVAAEGAPEPSALLVDVGALVALLLAGEILPKSIALRARVPLARLLAPVIAVAFVVLKPVRALLIQVLNGFTAAIGKVLPDDARLTPEDLATVLASGAEQGELDVGEADLLAEIVELGDIRVREIMTPRVDTVMLDLEETPEQRAATIQLAVKRRLTWLPVVAGDPDSVRGAAALRDLLANPERPLEQLVMPVMFVPEVAYALAMLGSMRDARVAEAVVVDEWGGTAGVVTLEDLFEEIVGELRVEGEELEKPVIPLGEGRFRVSGALSIHDWNDLLGRRIVPNEFETVGGYVLALLGRLPRAGDRVVLGGALTCEVREVRGRRVHTVDLCVVDEEGPPEVSA